MNGDFQGGQEKDSQSTRELRFPVFKKSSEPSEPSSPESRIAQKIKDNEDPSWKDWLGETWNSAIRGVGGFSYNLRKNSGLADEKDYASFLEAKRNDYPDLYESYQNNLKANSRFPAQSVIYSLATNIDDRKKLYKVGEELETFRREGVKEGGVEVAGFKVPQEKAQKIKKTLLGGTLTGLTESVPAMVLSAPTMGVAFFDMAYQGADEEIKRLEREKGLELSQSDKETYKLAIAVPSMILERVGLSGVLKNTAISKRLASLAANRVIKRVVALGEGKVTAATFNKIAKEEAKGLKGFVDRIGTGFLSEAETGGLQQLAADAVEQSMNMIKGKEIFDPKTAGEIAYDAIYSAVQEGIGGGIMSTIVGGTSKPQMTTEEKKQVVEFVETLPDLEDVKDYIVENAKGGNIERGAAKRSYDTIKNYKEALSKLPDGLSEDNKVEALDLVLEKQKLQKQAEGLDSSIRERLIDPQIKAVEEQLVKVISNDIKTEEQVPSTEQAGEAAVEAQPDTEVDKKTFDERVMERVRENRKGRGLDEGGFATKEEFDQARAEIIEEMKAEREKNFRERGKPAVETSGAVQLDEETQGELDDVMRDADFTVSEQEAPTRTSKTDAYADEGVQGGIINLIKTKGGELGREFVGAIERIKSTLGEGYKVVVLDEARYRDVTNTTGRGAFDTKNKVLYLNAQQVRNLDKDNVRAVYHEAIHPILTKRFGEASADFVRFKQDLVNAINRSLSGQDAATLIARLEAFEAQYGDKTTEQQAEEFMTELGAIMASEDVELLKKSGLLNRIKELINNLLRKLGSDISLDTENDVVEFMNSLAQGVRGGVAAEQILGTPLSEETGFMSESDVPIYEEGEGTISESRSEKGYIKENAPSWLLDNTIDIKELAGRGVSIAVFYDNQKVGEASVTNVVTGKKYSRETNGGFGYSQQEKFRFVNNQGEDVTPALAHTSLDGVGKTISLLRKKKSELVPLTTQNNITGHLGNKDTLFLLKDVFLDSATSAEIESEIFDVILERTENVAVIVPKKKRKDPEVKEYTYPLRGVFQGIPTQAEGGVLEQMFDRLEEMSFADRGTFFQAILQTKRSASGKPKSNTPEVFASLNYKYGFPTIEEISQGVTQTEFANSEMGDIIAFVEVDRAHNRIYTTSEQYKDVGEKSVKLAGNDFVVEYVGDKIPAHVSYPFLIKGSNVGYLEKYLDVTTIFPDLKDVKKTQSFYKAGRRGESAPEGIVPLEEAPLSESRRDEETFLQESRAIINEQFLSEEKQVAKFRKAGVDNKQTQQAINDIGLKGVKFTKEGIEEAIQKAFDDLAARAESFVMTEDSKAITGAIMADIEAMRADGASESEVAYAERGLEEGSPVRGEYIRKFQDAQRNEIRNWVSYLNQSDYNTSFKYLILDGVLTNNYDKKRNKYVKRDRKTLRSVTPFNAASLAELYQSDSKEMLKDYTDIQEKNAIALAKSRQVATTTKGEWIKYDGGRDVSNEDIANNASELAGLVSDTPWCTKTNAASQLRGGDFYVYATKGEDGSMIPRIAIRMEGDQVSEVRGVASEKQDLEPSMNPVAEKFLKENIPNDSGQQWLDSIEYNEKAEQLLQDINEKGLNRERMVSYFELLPDEKKYTLDYGRNGHIERLEAKIEELVENNELADDLKGKVIMPSIQRYSSRRIANRENLGNAEFVIGELELKPSDEDRRLRRLTGDSEFKVQYVSEDATVAGDVTNIKFVGGNLRFFAGGSPISVEVVGGDVYAREATTLGNLREVGGDVRVVSGDFYESYAKIRDLGKLERVGGDLDLSSSKDAPEKGFIKTLGSLKEVGGSLTLNDNVESLGDLEVVGGILNMRSSNIKSLGNKIKSVRHLQVGYSSLRRKEDTFAPLEDFGSLEKVENYIDLSFDNLTKTIQPTENNIRFVENNIGVFDVAIDNISDDRQIVRDEYIQEWLSKKITQEELERKSKETLLGIKDAKDYIQYLKDKAGEAPLQESRNLAPNGQPSNLNNEQYKIVRTPEFKRWFGDWENDPANASKVVDDNGEPLPQSHFTNAYFDAFKYKESGFHFGDPSIKEDLSIAKDTRFDREINVFLSIKNPLRVEDSHRFDPPILINQLLKNNVITQEEFNDLDDLFYDMEEGLTEDEYYDEYSLVTKQSDVLNKILEEKGYDGMVYENRFDSEDSKLTYLIDEESSKIYMKNREGVFAGSVIPESESDSKSFLVFESNKGNEYVLKNNEGDEITNADKDRIREMLNSGGFVSTINSTKTHSDFEKFIRDVDFKDSYITFKSSQSKLADGSNRTFDPEKEGLKESRRESMFINRDERLSDYDGIFSTTKTQGQSTDVINDDVYGRRGYFFFEKGLQGDVVMMSPEDYLAEIRKGGKSEETQKRQITEEQKNRIKDAIDKGDKINMPFLKYYEDGKYKQQEGQNRAAVAIERGEKLIPVAIIRDVSDAEIKSTAIRLKSEAINAVGEDVKDIKEYLGKNLKLFSSPFVNRLFFSEAPLQESRNFDRKTEKAMEGKFYQPKIDERFNKASKRQMANKKLFDRQGIIRRALQDANDLITQAALSVRNGSSAAAKKMYERFNKNIFLNVAGAKLAGINEIIMLRRIISIYDGFDRGIDTFQQEIKDLEAKKKRTKKETARLNSVKKQLADLEAKKANFKNPRKLNRESALARLDEIKQELRDETGNDQQFFDMDNRASRFFDAMREILKRKLDEGLITQDEYFRLSKYEYSPRMFVDKVFDLQNGDFAKHEKRFMGYGLSEKEFKKLKEGSEEDLFTEGDFLLRMVVAASERRVFANRLFKQLGKKVDSYDWLSDTKKNGFSELTYKEDGESRSIYVRNDIAEEIENADSAIEAGLGKVGKYFGTNILRAMATGYNPLFPLSNIPMDFANVVMFTDTYDDKSLIMAMIELSNDFRKNLAGIGTITAAFRGTTKADPKVLKNLEEAFEAGIGMDFLTNQGRVKFKTVEGSKLERIGQTFGDFMSSFGENSELAMRLSVYNKVKADSLKKRKDGKDAQFKDMNDAEIRAYAAFKARATIDFSQGGSLAKSLDKMSPYFNASLQGLRVAGNYIRTNPAKFGKKFGEAGLYAITMSFAMQHLFEMFGWDDDDKEAIPEYHRRNYFIIPLPESALGVKISDDDGNKKYIKIRKLPQLAPLLGLFDLVGEATYRSMSGESEKNNKEFYTKGLVDFENTLKAATVFGDMVLEFDEEGKPSIDVGGVIQYSPPVAKAMGQYITNYDFFRERNISYEKLYNQASPEFEGKFDDNVEEFYKEFGELTGMSPKRTKNAVEVVTTSPSTNLLVGVGYGIANAIMTGDKSFKDVTKGMEKRAVGTANKKYIKRKPSGELNKLLQEYKDNQFVVRKELTKMVVEDNAPKKDVIQYVNDIEDRKLREYAIKKYKKLQRKNKFDDLILDRKSVYYNLDDYMSENPELAAEYLFNEFGSLTNPELREVASYISMIRGSRSFSYPQAFMRKYRELQK